jgi:hypothetical protein
MAKAKTLTEKQLAVLDTACALFFQNGVFPSVRELCGFFCNEETGKPMFPNAMKGHLTAIEKAGYTQNRGAGKARSTAITHFSEYDNRFGITRDDSRTVIVLPINGKIQVQFHTESGIETKEFTYEAALLTAKHAGVDIWIGNPYNHLAEIALERL